MLALKGFAIFDRPRCQRKPNSGVNRNEASPESPAANRRPELSGQALRPSQRRAPPSHRRFTPKNAGPAPLQARARSEPACLSLTGAFSRLPGGRASIPASIISAETPADAPSPSALPRSRRRPRASRRRALVGSQATVLRSLRKHRPAKWDQPQSDVPSRRGSSQLSPPLTRRTAPGRTARPAPIRRLAKAARATPTSAPAEARSGGLPRTGPRRTSLRNRLRDAR